VIGTKGRIEFDGQMLSPSAGRLIVEDSVVEVLEGVPFPQTMRYEAAEVVSCLRAGRLESSVIPLDDSVTVMEVTDEIRRQIGLRFPFEPADEGPQLS
jgi:hypothetical protein